MTKKSKKLIFLGAGVLFAPIIGTVALTSCSTSNSGDNPKPTEKKQIKIKENFIQNVGATSGSAPNAAGSPTIKYNPNGILSLPTIIITPEHVGDEYFSLILPEKPNLQAFEGESVIEITANDPIRYELVTLDPNWNVQNNVISNKNPLNVINEFTIKGTIQGTSDFEFHFNVKFIRSVNTSSMFLPTGSSTEQQGGANPVDIQAKNNHNVINVVSGKETANFFNLTLPTVTKNNMFENWTNAFPENSVIEYKPISATNDNPFSLNATGVISNNVAITSPKHLYVDAIIKSSADKNQTVAISIEVIISPKVNVTATDKLITKVESSNSNATGAVYQQGQATVQNNTITITPADANDKYFKITLPKVTTDGMFNGLDPTSYPTGSKINYGPLYSTNPNLDFSHVDENTALLFNKPNMPLTPDANRIDINVFVYDTSGQSIKIPMIINFNVK